jgi:hypothetical protein
MPQPATTTFDLELEDPCFECGEKYGHYLRTNFRTLVSDNVATQLLPGIGQLKAQTEEGNQIYVNYCWRTGLITKYFTVQADHTHQQAGIPFCLLPWAHRQNW